MDICHQHDLCTGCRACMGVCKHNAIYIKYSQGYAYPTIDEDKCNDCGLCQKQCPANNIECIHSAMQDAELNKRLRLYHNIDGEYPVNATINDTDGNPHTLATPLKAIVAFAQDEERRNSSSGGLFYVLARYLLTHQDEVGSWRKNHDVGKQPPHKVFVVGCVLEEEPREDSPIPVIKAEHVITDSLEGIEAMRGSKYVQSSIGEVLLPIRSQLKAGNTVLFAGTPCQVAGLKTFLGKGLKNMAGQLITFDLICHGVSSSQLLELSLQAEVDKLEQAQQKKVIAVSEVRLRDKSKVFDHSGGWGNMSFVAHYDDHNSERIYLSTDDSIFYYMFNRNIGLRPACVSCPYSALKPRLGDLTIGDPWGIDGLDQINDHKGISLVLANSKQGSKLMDCILPNLKHYHSVAPLHATLSQPNLRSHSVAHATSNNFMSSLFAEGWDQPLNGKALKDHSAKLVELINSADSLRQNCVAIANFNFEQQNYGAVLTAVALEHALNEQGFEAHTINYEPLFAKRKIFNPKFVEFKHENLHYTEFFDHPIDVVRLNDQYGNFVTGSDQVLGPMFNHEDWPVFHLAIAHSNKRTLSCAGSFGCDWSKYQKELLANENTKQLLKNLLTRLDPLTVRERESGCHIAKELLGRDAVFVLDPVFYCNREFYLTLASKSNLDPWTTAQESAKLKIAVYDQDPRQLFPPQVESCLSSAERSGDYQLYSVAFNKDTPYDFLKVLSSADLIVTTSFHGTCFAIIFNIPFVVIGGGVRVSDLLRLCGDTAAARQLESLPENLWPHIQRLPELDWININSALAAEIERSLGVIDKGLKQDITDAIVAQKQSLLNFALEGQEQGSKSDIAKSRIKRSLYSVLYHVCPTSKFKSKWIKHKQRVRLAKTTLHNLEVLKQKR